MKENFHVFDFRNFSNMEKNIDKIYDKTIGFRKNMRKKNFRLI